MENNITLSISESTVGSWVEEYFIVEATDECNHSVKLKFDWSTKGELRARFIGDANKLDYHFDFLLLSKIMNIMMDVYEKGEGEFEFITDIFYDDNGDARALPLS